MVDSFADLWDSSAPNKPPSSSRKLGSAIPHSSNARKPQQDTFALLSSAASAPNSRPITPSMIGQNNISKASATTSGDAFSGLLAGSLVGGSQNSANLTIAERAAMAEREKREYLHRYQQSVKAQTSAWDGLDKLANPPPNNTSDAVDDDWFVPSKPALNRTSVKPPSAPQVEDWGLEDFVSKPSSRSTPDSQAILDLDDLSLLAPTASNVGPSPPTIHEPMPRFDSPGNFDFGDREDSLLDDDDSQDEDDILGALSKPVGPKRTSPSINSNRATPSPQPSYPNSRPVSPPPHILGQIVEMGFSIEQARVALAATNTGLDVQAALETLLSNCADSFPSDRRREEEPNPHLPPPPPPPPPPPRSNSTTKPAQERLSRETPSPSGSQPELNLQADKILTQASEIGLSMFNRANAFWNQSKEVVQKAYEERAKANASSGPSQPAKPRWMQEEGLLHQIDAETPWKNRDGGRSDNTLSKKQIKSVRSMGTPHTEPRIQPNTADLFSDEPVAYVSPFRRGRQPSPEAVNHPTTTTQSSSSSKPPLRAPSPVRLIQRQVVPASRSTIAASAQHKSIGADKFKLGQYAEAETAYAAAIAVLPVSHLLLIPLYNNRALTRLKTGDHTGAVEDCSTVISLIGSNYHPSREAKVDKEEEGGGVNLGDGLVKAWRRRAEAYEGKEKWAMAQSDWESVAAAEWAGRKIRDESVRGAGRCRRMVTANTSGELASSEGHAPARPTIKAATNRRGPSPPSEAQMKLRDANKAAEAEEQARHELKDTVDARLLAWKGGKETNIRALIASLDTVLWFELGWQKVGMAELVTPAQVKIRYTKAIAKLHPDKLNARNTTLEQRMIANGVFGALNEAWNAFKQ